MKAPATKVTKATRKGAPRATTRKGHRSARKAKSAPAPIPLCLQRLDTPWVCESCGDRGWHDLKAFEHHQDEHLEGKAKANLCFGCGSSFAQKTALVTHSNGHTGERPHKCRFICTQSFADPSSRTRHEKEIHCPEYGWKCLRIGCNASSFKRKSAFTQHLCDAHNWLKSAKLPDGVYSAAKQKCADDYFAGLRESKAKTEAGKGTDTSNSSDQGDEQPVFNGKRLRSGSTSSEDYLQPPPAKKQAIEPSPTRRNAVYSIAMPVPHPYIPPQAGHKRGDSDDHSASTASEFSDTFSGAYYPTGHRFTNCSPPIQDLNSNQSYQKAIDRVASPQTHPLQSVGTLMYHGASGYGVAPTSLSPRDSRITLEPLPYPYHNAGTGVFTRSPWTANTSSYGSQWSLSTGVTQSPHGVSPSHMAPEGSSTRGILPPSHSGPSHFIGGHGVNLSAGGHQAELSSGSTSLDTRFGQAGGSFWDHQALTRSPSEHSNSPHQDSRLPGGGYELARTHYLGYPPSQPLQMPRTLISNDGGNQERLYN